LNSKWSSISKNTTKVNQRLTHLIYNSKKERFNVKTNFLKILIYFDLLYMGLSRSHDQGLGFDRLTRVKPCYFFYFLSMRLSWFHDLGHEFGRLNRVFFMFFLIDFFLISSFNVRLIGN
jgi:hypothetical protein